MSKVTVVTPVFNGEDRITDTLMSALEQVRVDGSDFPLEVVVVDDASTDETSRIVCSVADWDKRVRLHRLRRNLGGPGHRANNYGILMSDGDYLVRLDSDDVFLSGHLDRCRTVLDMNPDIDFVSSNYIEVDEATGEEKLVSVEENPFASIAVGVMYRRELLAKVGIYDPSFFFAEYDLMHRIFQADGKRGFVPEPGFKYNRHSDSQTGSDERVQQGRQELFDKWGEFPMRQY